MRCALQLDMMTSCSIGITLLVPQGSNTFMLSMSAQQVAAHAHVLHQHQLTLGMSVEAATEAASLPEPIVLHVLKAYLCQFDTFSVPTDQPAAIKTTVADARSQIDLLQLKGLQNSNLSVCTCCIATSYGVVDVVATMTSLTTLHLTIADCSQVDLQPLAQLGLITDLALQVSYRNLSCCEGVLRSNKQTLQSVTLTAGEWSAASYCSLQHIPQLKILNLTVMEIDTPQAQALGGITAELFRLTLHGVESTRGFQALHDSHPGIHELTSRNPTLMCYDHYRLPELPSLQRLTLRECTHLTGKSLPTYPQVKELTLIECPKISGVGLQHIIRKALPALEVTSFQVTAQYGMAMHLNVCGLNALHFGRNLHTIDLRGVSGLTGARLAKFDYTMHRKQRQDKAQPCVTLLLPWPPVDKPEFVLESNDAMLLPNLFKLPTSPYVNSLSILW